MGKEAQNLVVPHFGAMIRDLDLKHLNWETVAPPALTFQSICVETLNISLPPFSVFVLEIAAIEVLCE